MRGIDKPLVFGALLAFAATAAAQNPAAADSGAKVTRVTAQRILQADREPGNWLSHGRDYAERRYSPLEQVTADNAGKLGLAWSFDLAEQRGIEATPIVVDGRMYTTSAWSVVYALDAKTGKQLWKYDPKVPPQWAKYTCCDVVNRGVAAWGDRVYVGTIDGRLIALDAKTGKPAWDVNTIDRKQPHSITGAPRVVDGKVIIGNTGGEFAARGYVGAYDAQTGKLAWRFYTVPGDPKKGFESPALKKAAATWTGEWWKAGGGGPVWDAIAYDPKLDLLYFGTGNGAPWNRNVRSPGGGDNLFLSSIIAVRPKTGEYVWHYQVTPGDTWDYDAAQQLTLLDLTIDGKPRQALVQASKNGFFYVIDRTNGKLISATPYVATNWATGIDEKTGRPIETPEARYPDRAKPQLIVPSPFGAHNWHPMAYSPKTGYVYLPAQELPFVFQTDAGYKYLPGQWNLGINMGPAALPEDPKEVAKILPLLKGRLLAWDPVAKKEVFKVEHPGPWNGGVLATAGNVIFQGTPSGEFAAYRADNGAKLWSTQAQTGVVSGPISYSVDGEQYVAVTVGWGTVFGLVVPGSQRPKSRVLAYKLGGQATLPPLQIAEDKWPELLPVTGSVDQIAKGKTAYLARCIWCHGDAAMSGGVLPDLRLVPKQKHQIWNRIVLDGALEARGMPGFKGVLTKEDAEAVQQYVLSRAHATKPPPK